MTNTTTMNHPDAITLMMKTYPPVLCAKEVADILVVSLNTAYELIRCGAIRSVRVGRNYRIPLDAVIHYLHET